MASIESLKMEVDGQGNLIAQFAIDMADLENQFPTWKAAVDESLAQSRHEIQLLLTQAQQQVGEMGTHRDAITKQIEGHQTLYDQQSDQAFKVLHAKITKLEEAASDALGISTGGIGVKPKTAWQLTRPKDLPTSEFRQRRGLAQVERRN